MSRLSIVTVCMNRREHLLTTALKVAKWPHHHEHLILDWSSEIPLLRGELPDDPRIRLIRVDGERDWHQPRAYNLACRLSTGQRLLKLDADCWPAALSASDVLLRETSRAVFGSGSDGRVGQCLLDRALLNRVGGFNEVLLGYGFDDKDFRARLEAVGATIEYWPGDALGVIAHSASLRVGQADAASSLQRVSARALKRATALANRALAAGHPWSSHRTGSTYVTDPSSGALRVERASIPRPSLKVDDEAQRLRRSIYWGLMFNLPEELVVRMPLRILPNDVRGRFQLNRIHRCSWYLLRPLWAWPLLLLQVIQRPRAKAQAQQQLWDALETQDLPMLLDSLQRLPKRLRRNVVERLLFQRGLRPQDPAEQRALFDALFDSALLDVDQCTYAGIALGWSLIRLNLMEPAAALVPMLLASAEDLEADPATFTCMRRNRENRLKQLVSIWTVVIHLLLLSEQSDQIPALARAAHRLLRRLELQSIPADVLLRMSSNWARCLVWQWPQEPEILAADLTRLLDAVNHQRCSSCRPDEDHRAFLKGLQNSLSRNGEDLLQQALTLSTEGLLAALDHASVDPLR